VVPLDRLCESQENKNRTKRNQALTTRKIDKLVFPLNPRHVPRSEYRRAKRIITTLQKENAERIDRKESRILRLKEEVKTKDLVILSLQEKLSRRPVEILKRILSGNRQSAACANCVRSIWSFMLGRNSASSQKNITHGPRSS